MSSPRAVLGLNESHGIASIAELERRVRDKIQHEQAGVPTAFDNVVLTGTRRLRETQGKAGAAGVEGSTVHELFERYAAFAARPDAMTYGERAAETDRWRQLPWEPSPLQLSATQGVGDCLTWRGMPLFKSVFDFAMYPMLLWNLRPATIVELGSGTGASALWFADLLRLFRIHAHVYSLDLHRPRVDDPEVTFIEGDGRAIETVFDTATLDRLPHPWLVVEDIHVNTLGVLRHFAQRSRSGDYLIVEDSLMKRADLAAFDREYGANFKVDTRYTDFFGRNATFCPDSIFVRIYEEPGTGSTPDGSGPPTPPGEDDTYVIEL